MKKPEKECPKCHGELEWKVVRNPFGSPQYNGLCSKCFLVLRGREPPQIAEGKELERSGTTKGLDAMHPDITKLPCDVQLGILRERYHGVEGE